MDTSEWQSFEKLHVKSGVFIKKNPDKMIENVECDTAEKSLKNASMVKASVLHYSEVIIDTYKTWKRNEEYYKIMQHFETKLLIISSLLLSLYVSAAVMSGEYRKGVEMYEKYSSLGLEVKTIMPVICYYKIGNEAKALEQFTKIEHAITIVDIAILFKHQPLVSIVERIADGPRIRFLLSEQRLQYLLKHTKDSPVLRGKLLKLLDEVKKEDSSLTISYYSNLRVTYDNLLQQYMNNSSSAITDQLLDILRKLVEEDAQNFTRIVNFYFSKSQQVLSEPDFHDLLFRVCSMLIARNMGIESMDLICQFCDKNNVATQEQFFSVYCGRLRNTMSLHEPNELSRLQFFIDRFDFSSKDFNRDTHKYLAYYYVAKGEYDKAMHEMKDFGYSAFTRIMEYFFMCTQNEAVVFIFEAISPKFMVFQNKDFHPLQIAQYLECLIYLRRTKDVIDYWMKWKQEASVEMPVMAKLVVLHAAALDNDMRTFTIAFEELKRVDKARISASNTERIVKALKRHNNNEWIIRFYNEFVAKQAIPGPRFESTMTLFKQYGVDQRGIT